jgi:hypothetical protein
MNVLYVSRYVKTFHCLSWMYCLHSWQTMKCLYIPRDIQYIYDKQGNVFTYLERYSTFMTNNEMSLHTERHTVHSWQTMKCLYIPTDIQYIHDKQWNVYTYPETYITFMTNNEMSLHTQRHTVHSWQTMKCLYIPTDKQYIRHECTVCLSVCKDISLFVMNVLCVSGYVKTFHWLSWMYCMSVGM